MKYDLAFLVKVLVVTICILFAIFVIWKIYKATQQNPDNWPPEINKCPDYWTYNEDKDKCLNVYNLGNNNVESVNPITKESSDREIKEACNKAFNNKYKWSGVDDKC